MYAQTLLRKLRDEHSSALSEKTSLHMVMKSLVKIPAEDLMQMEPEVV